MGKGSLVGLVLMDLQKAFDTVDHRILLDKLESMGVSSVSWFRSYLEGRCQCVEVDGVRSSFEAVDCGVPQGSILGPLLFLVYVNDMHLSVNCRLSLYADDSALVFSHSDPVVIGDSLSAELSNCREWLIDNKLTSGKDGVYIIWDWSEVGAGSGLPDYLCRNCCQSGFSGKISRGET